MRSLYHFLRVQLFWLCDQRWFRFVLRTWWLYYWSCNCFVEFARLTIRSLNDQPDTLNNQLLCLVAGFGLGLAAPQLEEWLEEDYQNSLHRSRNRRQDNGLPVS